MQTVQLVIFYLYLMFHACLQTFNEMRYKVFGWELNTPESCSSVLVYFLMIVHVR
jgi:hypothetical protein